MLQKKEKRTFCSGCNNTNATNTNIPIPYWYYYIPRGLAVMGGPGSSQKTADLKLTLSVLLCKICEFHKMFSLSALFHTIWHKGFKKLTISCYVTISVLELLSLSVLFEWRSSCFWPGRYIMLLFFSVVTIYDIDRSNFASFYCSSIYIFIYRTYVIVLGEFVADSSIFS